MFVHDTLPQLDYEGSSSTILIRLSTIQALSCDEAFLDMTECLHDDPEEVTQRIRSEIFYATKCTASAGIAENMLLARLATRSAKPNGQCFIPAEKVYTCCC